MCPCTCPVTLHRRRPTPSSTIRPSRATAALRQQTGTAGTLTISRTKITTWPQASPHTPNSEVAESSQDVSVFKDSNIFVTCWILVVKCINLQKTYKNVFVFFCFFFISIPLLNNIHIFWQLQPVLCGLFNILFVYQIDFKAAATKV